MGFSLRTAHRKNALVRDGPAAHLLIDERRHPPQCVLQPQTETVACLCFG